MIEREPTTARETPQDIIEFSWNSNLVKSSLVLKDESWVEDRSGLEVMAFCDSSLKTSYNEMTLIVNDQEGDGQNGIDPLNQFLYQRTLASFYRQLSSLNMGRRTISVSPEGEFASRFYPKALPSSLGLTKPRFYDSSVQFGVKEEAALENLDGQTVIIPEVGIGSGAEIACILELLRRKGVQPRSVEVHAFAAFQKAAKMLIKRAEETNLPFMIRAGVLVFETGKEFQLYRTVWEGYSQGVLAIGNPKNYCQPLPDDFPKAVRWKN